VHSDMRSDTATTDWLSSWLPEDGAIAAARARAEEVGVPCVDSTTGSLLRLLAAVGSARAVVELGTGAGVSALWLLSGMREDGVLTTVDPETEHQRLAKQSLTEAGYGTGRVRLIAGRALEVLPRLSDGVYDLVFCDALPQENADYLAAALRLLRPGGLVVFAGALNGGRVADPSARDADTVALRELAKAVRERADLTPCLLPVGAGLLAAVVGVSS
jgi:predicted O-methyltransferase YrrM